MQRSEIIVVGGGLGGLCSAALLARRGLSVRLLERASSLGGRARSRRRGGYVHNLGAHALYRNGPAMRLLGQLGIRPRGGLVTGRGAVFERGGVLEALPTGVSSTLRTRALSVRGRLQLLRVLATLSDRRARELRGQTVQQWLDSEASDPDARAMLEMFVRLGCYAHVPDRLSAEAAVRQLSHALRHGVLYLDGGWQQLVDAAEAQARRAGVRIELGAGVERIEHSGAVAQAVVLRDGRRLRAASVVAAIDPRTLASLLPDDAHAARWAAEATPLRAACLDLGVRHMLHPQRLFALSADEPIYYANHSGYAQLAPEGAHCLHVVRYLSPDEDGRALEPQLSSFLERLQPGVTAAPEVRRFVPNLVVHNDLPRPEGARVVHPEIRGLCVVGDWVSSRAMLADATLDSARRAVEHVASLGPGRGVAAADSCDAVTAV